MTATKNELKAKLKQATAMMTWALKSESAKLINALLDLARSEPGIPILPHQLDKDAWLLNCTNGTLDLKTGKLYPHRREDLLTKMCPTPYRPDAACPTWLKFLDGVFLGRDGLITFVHRLLGYCLTGDVSDDVFPVFWGGGSNGKTTLLNTVMAVVGGDYAMKAQAEMLLQTRGERHPTEKMDLFGRRLVVASETPQGARLNEALVKDLTGGEKIRGRQMRQDTWEFEATHKLILQTNYRPVITGADKGIWRRLRLVPFEASFWNPDDHPDPEAEGLAAHLRQDKGLEEKLAVEAPGILAWLVRGCQDWRRFGLPVPEEIRAATAGYREAEDSLAQFIDECCVIGADLRCKLTALYPAYKKWGESAGEKVLGKKAFAQALVEKKFQRFISNGTGYCGLDLRRAEEMFE